MNRIFLISLSVSVGWHFILGYFFSFALPLKRVKERYYPVYYLREGGEGEVVEGSILPYPELPQRRWETTLLKSPSLKESSSLPLSFSEIPFIPPSPSPPEVTTIIPSFSFPFPVLTPYPSSPPILWKGEKRYVLFSPSPNYPLWAQEKGWEGKVEVEFLVSPRGEVKEVRIVRSSGYLPLDLVAMKYVYYWKFSPGKGFSRGRIEFEFSLPK